MNDLNDRLSYLFQGYYYDTASEAEKQELMEMLGGKVSDEELTKLIQDVWEKRGKTEKYFSPETNKVILHAILNGNEKSFAPKLDKKIRYMQWTRVAAAAIIILILGAGTYWYLFRQTEQDKSITIAKANDVKAPVSNKAMITLANGKQIVLDSAGNGTLAKEGNVNVAKLADGKIAYSGTTNEIEYNTLSNPRGSKVINLILSDGSKVWLNTESSLKYPTAFSGKERKVEITGEGYFEVAHNTAKPFMVSVNGLEVKDLGTHFNINAYNDEPTIKTTLLEGGVNVSKGSTNTVLKPGQQAEFDNGKFKIASVDVEETVAWKNGKFIFEGNNIQSVMRQLARWYDVDVKYEANITKEEFVGVISQNKYEDISKVLDMLEKTHTVSFLINGRTITVIHYKK
ncbi:MAG: DUF4974 domain-containing protein [Bacteroidota bacterium]|nr:DUF4974 domain-containing protein [Bacteroidota bacterium]